MEMRVIYMCIYTEQTLKNLFYHLLEASGKSTAHLTREYAAVINL